MTQGLGDFTYGIAVTHLESGKKDTLAMSAERGLESMELTERLRKFG